MIICDCCNSRLNKTKKVSIHIDMPEVKDNSDVNLDFCEDCIKYVNIHSLMIGIKTIKENNQ